MKLTAAQARRVILSAQGIGADRAGPVGMRQVQGVISRLGQFQIDSVNVLARAHLMPLYTRLGAYDTALLARAAQRRPRRLFEYWGHAACLIDVTLYPALQFRREAAHRETWGRMRALVDQRPEIPEAMVDLLGRRGPATARELDLGEARQKDRWGWNWSLAKTALEWLYWCGRVAVAGRNAQFERVYDLPERVIPAPFLDACQPWAGASADEREELAHQGQVDLVRRAASCLGVVTAACLRDYFRTEAAPTKAAIDHLVSSGELLPVEVEGVAGPTWLWHQARRPRQVRAATLVSPFDSLVFERRRLAAFFHTDYRIGLYTPKEQRTHGYYVYLFLLDESFAARVDLKADRRQKLLLVRSAWLEAGRGPDRSRIAVELAAELGRLAGWLGLTGIDLADEGDLASDLARAIRAVPIGPTTAESTNQEVLP